MACHVTETSEIEHVEGDVLSSDNDDLTPVYMAGFHHGRKQASKSEAEIRADERERLAKLAEDEMLARGQGDVEPLSDWLRSQKREE